MSQCIEIPELSYKLLSQFWSKVNKTNHCWLWIAGLDSDGYGAFHINGKLYKAHRVSWALEFGNTQLDVLHSCDTPACVRPNHLFEGTAKNNVHDAMSKGRWPKGENCLATKVTDVQIAEIRFKVALGMTCKEVGLQYGIGPTQVCRICNGQSRN